MEDTIVSLRFTDVDRALRALYEFRQLDRDRRPRVRGAVLVQRSPQGAIDVPQPDPHGDGQYLPPGGIVGMLLDVLRGPLGILFARPTDEFGGGSGHPAHEAEREIALDQIRRSLEPGVILVAEVADAEPDGSTRRSARWAEMSLAALPARSTPRSVGPTRRRRPSCLITAAREARAGLSGSAPRGPGLNVGAPSAR